jgi:predicted ferric reductase
MDQPRKAVLIGLFILGTVAPILIMLLAPQPASRQWWREVAVALGFLGFALMGWQFVPMAQLPFLRDTFGRPALLKFHIDVSLAAFYLVLAHPLVLLLGNPRYIVTFNLLSGVWRMLTGVIALVLTMIIVGTCVWRSQLGMRRNPWIWLHDIVAVAIIGFSLHHILGVGYYTAVPLQRWLWVVYVLIWGVLIVYTRATAINGNGTK